MAPADADDAWDAVIARAKVKAASSGAPSLRPVPPVGASAPRALGSPRPLPRNAWLEDQVTPPPLPMASPTAPRAGAPERVQATLDALMSGGLKRPLALRPPPLRRPAEEDLVTPPPVVKPRWAGGALSGTLKRH